MRKTLLLLILTLFSFSAIHAEISWEINGIKCNLSDDGTLTISGTGNIPNYGFGQAPWYNNRNIIKEVVIEDGVTSIGNYAFRDWLGLTSVTIPNSVTSIGNYAFSHCSCLTSITIPNSVTSIEDNAFSFCSSLTSVTIPNSVTSIGGAAFCQCSSLTSITIPNSVTSIGERAFYGCYRLTSITIPNSVTSIGEYAFYGCSGLTSITIPNSVTSIGSYAFSDCSGLTSITIPNSVTSIGDMAFRGCTGLNSITVEKGNTKYDSRDNCNAIIETNTNKLIAGCKNTTIPSSVTSIGNYAFYGCGSLASVTIPNSVTSIGDMAFQDCTGLNSITVEKGNTRYDSRDNCNAIIETNTNKLIAGCKNTIIPNSVMSIGESAFYGCSGLTSITIPNSVTSIGNWAFSYCSGLTSITFNGSTPPEFGNYAFQSVNKSIPVYVPANSIEAYKSVLGGLGLSDIKVAPLIFLKDGEAYTQDSQIDGMDIYYTRSFANTNWQALYLPFSLKYEDWKDDFEVAYINTVR